MIFIINITKVASKTTDRKRGIGVLAKKIGGIFMNTFRKKRMGLFRALITNNSGLSSKSFFLVAVTIIGIILLLVPAFTLVVEVVFTHTIATDLTGMAAYIGAVAALFGTAGITKAWSERWESKNEDRTGSEDYGQYME